LAKCKKAEPAGCLGWHFSQFQLLWRIMNFLLPLPSPHFFTTVLLFLHGIAILFPANMPMTYHENSPHLTSTLLTSLHIFNSVGMGVWINIWSHCTFLLL
jgi:hypothetical protein